MLLLKNLSNSGTGQVSVPLVSTDLADDILKSDICTLYLVAAAMGFAIVIIAICTVLATMLLEIGVDHIKLGVDILDGISNNGSKLLIRQRLMTMQCQNRFLYSF